MLRAVELRHLRYFVGVAEALNFTRAAEKLRVAQPSLSRQIRQLEEEIGVSLLERDRRKVGLTDAGRAFLEEARGILERGEEAIRAARHANGAPAVLNLGYVWGLFHSVIPVVVGNFRRAAPEVAVHLFDYTAMQQAEALTNGRLDVGFIGFAQEADAAGLARRKIGECVFMLALAREHPAARRRVIDLRSLARERFFAISDQTYPGAATIVASVCRKAGFRPRIVQAAERGHTLLALVAGNCGMALVPESLSALPHAGVVFRPLRQPPRGDVFVAWNTARRSVTRERFMGTLK
jgi:DNA-binding transcriptional LysR family regulator